MTGATEQEAPDPDRCAPPAGQPSGGYQLARLHHGPHGDDGHGRTREQLDHPFDREQLRFEEFITVD